MCPPIKIRPDLQAALGDWYKQNFDFYTAAKAWLKSANKSSMCSMPTLKRTMSALTPADFNSASFNWRWVVVAGWQAKDLASPMFTKRVNNCKASMKRAPASRPPLMPKLSKPEALPPKSRYIRAL